MYNLKIFLQFAKYKTLLVLIFAFPSFAQQTNDAKKIDSLLQLVKVCKVDTTKVELYFEQSYIYQNNNLEKCELINKTILQLSKVANYEKGFAHFYHNSAMICLKTNDIKKAIIESDKAITIYKKYNDIKNYLNVIYIKCHSLMRLQQNILAENTALENINFYKECYKNEQIGKLYYFLGCNHNVLNQFDKAITSFDKSLLIFRKSKNNQYVLKCYNEIAIIYLKTDQYIESLNYTTNGILNCTNADYNTDIYRRLLSNDASVKLQMHNNKGALLSLNKVLLLSKKSNDKPLYAFNLNLMAKIYFTEKKYIQSITKNLETIQINANKTTCKVAYQNLGNCYFETKKFKKAASIQNKLLKMIEEDNDLYDYYSIYKEISKTEFELGNYKKSALLNQQYTDYLIEYDSINNANDVKLLQSKFELKEKDLILKNLNIVTQNKDLELKQQKVYFYIALLIASLLITIIFGLAYIYKKIKFKNNQIERKRLKLEQSEINLTNSIQNQNVLLKELHHRVKNNMQLIISILSIQSRKANFKSIEKFMENARSRVDAMSIVHESLYQSDNFEKVNFQHYLDNLIHNLQKTFQKENAITFEINAQNFNFSLQTAIPLGIITNELVCNAFKHAFPNKLGLVRIDVTKINDDFYMKISDNGIGFHEKDIEKKSIGLDLVTMLTAQLQGKLESQSKNGTTFLIHFKETNPNQ